jgi:hypothetical protein
MMPFWLDHSLLQWLPAVVAGFSAAFVQFFVLAGRP